MNGFKTCVCLGGINVILGTFLEYRNSSSKHPITDYVGHLDYTKDHLYMCTHSFYSGFKFQKR